MESTNVEPREPLLRDQTETSSKLKLEAAPQSPFPTGSERPYRDSTFTFLFLTAILTTFTFGIIASTRTDTLNMDTKLRLSHYNSTTSKCEITQPQAPKASDSDPNSDSALVALSPLLLSALAQTIPLSLVIVFLLRRYTQTLVVPFVSVLSLLVGLGVSGGLLGGLWLFSWCLGVPEVWGAVMHGIKIFNLVFVSFNSAHVLWRELTGRCVENGVEVLRMATGFLKEHFVLLVVNPMLLAGAMVMVNGPIFTFMSYAFNVGGNSPGF